MANYKDIKYDYPASAITSGTFADARISSSSVTQHVTPFDDNDIINDLSTLALRQASDANRSAYNTNSQFVDVFQDSTGLDTLSDVLRNTSEYLSSQTAPTGGVNASTIMLVDGNSTSAPFTDLINGMTGSTNDIGGTGGTPTYNTGNQKWSGYNVLDLNDGTINYGTQYTSYWNGTGDYTVEFWFKGKGSLNSRERLWCFGNDSTNGQMSYGYDYGNPSDVNVYSGNVDYDPSGTLTHPSNDTSWHHMRFVRSGSVTYYFFDGTLIATLSGGNPTNTMNQKLRISGRPTSSGSGTEFFQAYYTDFMIHTTALSTSNYSVPTEKALVSTTAATGYATGTTITAPASVSSMGAILTYQDYSGTNALNTDLVVQLSADNGSNWSTATLTALPDFSTGIKMAKVNDLSVTAGTQLKYKLSFANQSAGSKVARVRGIALQF